MARVCIIGAGSSGIASCQVLQARGIDFDCFEKGSGIGGNWRYGNDNGMSSAYRSLFINTSRAMMEYATYPMPDDYPDYPHHTQIARYFEDYVDHFGFRDRIRFNTEVARVEPAGDDWEVTLADGESPPLRRRDGRQRPPLGSQVPRAALPRPASFTGEQLHSHWYREPDERFVDRRVLVLGIGNSATDIATEASRFSADDLPGDAPRRHVMPKFIGGVPLDQLARAGRTGCLRVHAADPDARGQARPGTDGELRAAQARPQARPGAPDRVGRPAQPDRPRPHRREAEHRAHRRLRSCTSATAPAPRSTRSSGAPATGSRSRSSTRR